MAPACQSNSNSEPLALVKSRARVSTWYRISVLLFILLSAQLFVASGGKAPALVELTGSPSIYLHGGSFFELDGSGFPEGQQATIYFRGALYLPGAPADERFRLNLAATAQSDHRLRALMPEAAGLGDQVSLVRHASFRGDITVEFHSKQENAPLIWGTWKNADLEFLPHPSLVKDDEIRIKAEDFVERLGLGSSSSHTDALRIDSILPEGKLEAAGLRPGDLILRANGVRVLSDTDLLPSSRSVGLSLDIKRPQLSPEKLYLSLAQSDRDYQQQLGILAAIGVGLALFFILRSFSGKTLRVLNEREMAEVFRQLRHHGGKPSLAKLSLAARTGMVLFAWAILLLTIRHQRSGSFGVDMILWGSLLAATLLRVLSATLSGGSWSKSWSLRGGLSAFVQSFVASLPLVLAVSAGALAHGGLRQQDWLREQELSPLKWLMLRDPGSLLLFLSALAVMIPLTTNQSGNFNLLKIPRDVVQVDQNAPSVQLAEWLQHQLFLVVLILEFTGLGRASSTYLAFCYSACASLFITLVLGALRNLLVHLRLPYCGRFVWRCFLSSLIGLGGLLLWHTQTSGPIFAPIREWTPTSLLTALLISVILFVSSVLKAAKKAPTKSTFNPWL